MRGGQEKRARYRNTNTFARTAERIGVRSMEGNGELAHNHTLRDRSEPKLIGMCVTPSGYEIRGFIILLIP